MPPREPLTSIVPAIVTAPVARRSSVALPLVVTVIPAGMLIVVKLRTPAAKIVFVVGANAPSAPVLGKSGQSRHP